LAALNAFLAITFTRPHPAVNEPSVSIATAASDAPDKDRIEPPATGKLPSPKPEV
jgi:hypothetical protein